MISHVQGGQMFSSAGVVGLLLVSFEQWDS